MISIKDRVVTCLLSRNELIYIPIEDNLRLQILPSVEYLPTCQRHQNAAFIRNQHMLVVWADSVEAAEERAESYLDQLVRVFSQGFSDYNEKSQKPDVLVKEAPVDSEDNSSGLADLEDEPIETPRRPVLIQAILTAVTLLLIIGAIGLGWRQIAIETSVDKSYIRLAFIIAAPFQIWLALVSEFEKCESILRLIHYFGVQFFMQSLAGCISQLLGPTNQMRINTKFYSGQKSRPISRNILPHITVQCPVYKESLEETIIPTMESVQDAIRTYEMQGGSANIFVCEDGMQVISEKEAEQRKQYYEEQRIGWVSRPKHKERPKAKGFFSLSKQPPSPEDGEQYFTRAGKFKKASNMNYGMAVSVRIEDKLAQIQRHAEWTQEDENREYRRCLAEVLDQDKGRTKADGNVRIGEYILLSTAPFSITSQYYAYTTNSRQRHSRSQ